MCFTELIGKWFQGLLCCSAGLCDAVVSAGCNRFVSFSPVHRRTWRCCKFRWDRGVGTLPSEYPCLRLRSSQRRNVDIMRTDNADISTTLVGNLRPNFVFLVGCVRATCYALRGMCYVQSTIGSYDRAFAFRALRNAEAVLTFLVGVLNFVKRSLSSFHCGRRCPSSCRLAFSSGGSVITFSVLRICDGVLVFSSARISEHGGVVDSCRKQELGPGYILAAE